MKRRAFTMIEVLVSLAIFALAAIVLGAAYVNVLTAYARAGEATRIDADVRFARDCLFREAELDEAEQGAEFESTDGRRVAWRARIEPTDIPDLFDVTFICESTGIDAAEPFVVEEQFRMLRPTWSEGSESDRLRTEMRDRITQYVEDLNARR